MRWTRFQASIVGLLLLLGISQAVQAQRNLSVAATAGDKRVALVIGNDTYSGVTPLEKAGNDARAMGRALTQVGFRTRSVINGTRAQMNAAINQFVEDVSAGGVGVFFFAGHGVQVANQNFLIPVDMQPITREADIADQSISLQSVQDKLADAKAKFTLLVIDACRDSPLPRRAGRSLGGTRGLTQGSSAEGQMVVFSAGANQQALDKLQPNDPNPNGVFTREFLPWVGKPGVTIREAVLGVRSAVRARARSVNHEQFPAIYDQAEGDFYFRPGEVAAPAVATVPDATLKPVPTRPQNWSAPPPSPSGPMDPVEVALWKEIENSNSREDFESLLKTYPNGRYAEQSRYRIQQMDDANEAEQARKVQEALAERKRLEDIAWAAAEQAGTVAGYERYRSAYGQGIYVALAEVRVRRFKPEEERRQVVAERRQIELKAEEEKLFAEQLSKVQRFKDCADCPEMVIIPAGSFQMGGRSGDELPVHPVTIGKSFALGQTEVTQAQWQVVMGNNPSNFKQCGPDCPVEEVSWNNAQEFIRKLNAKTGKTYRLPTEAEWEYACRAGGRHEYCGSDDLNSVGWYGAHATPVGNSQKTTSRVKGKQSNAFGLYDMSGNVSEWVQDLFSDNYQGGPGDGSAWERGGKPARVVRGGSWDLNPQYSRTAFRNGNSPGNRDFSIGFRLARMLP